MLTVINDLFIAADAGDCASVIPADISVTARAVAFFLKLPREVGWCHKR